MKKETGYRNSLFAGILGIVVLTAVNAIALLNGWPNSRPFSSDWWNGIGVFFTCFLFLIIFSSFGLAKNKRSNRELERDLERG